MCKMSEQANHELILSFFGKAWVQWPLRRDWRGWWADPPSTRLWRTTRIQERPRGSRKASVRTAPLRKRVREKIRRDPRRSMRRMARDKGVSKITMWRLCREDLGMIPYKKQRRQVLSEATKAKCLERGCQILKILRDGMMPPILWTDEMLFTVETVHNIHNDRMNGTSKGSLGIDMLSHFCHQKPASVMVWAGVTSDGKKTPLIFIQEGVKIDTAVYLHLLSEEVAPWIESEYGDTPIVFQQDGAQSPTFNLTQSFCEAVFPQFWAKHQWPPSPPDLNVMDFSI